MQADLCAGSLLLQITCSFSQYVLVPIFLFSCVRVKSVTSLGRRNRNPDCSAVSCFAVCSCSVFWRLSPLDFIFTSCASCLAAPLLLMALKPTTLSEPREGRHRASRSRSVSTGEIWRIRSHFHSACGRSFVGNMRTMSFRRGEGRIFLAPLCLVLSGCCLQLRLKHN